MILKKNTIASIVIGILLFIFIIVLIILYIGPFPGPNPHNPIDQLEINVEYVGIHNVSKGIFFNNGDPLFLVSQYGITPIHWSQLKIECSNIEKEIYGIKFEIISFNNITNINTEIISNSDDNLVLGIKNISDNNKLAYGDSIFFIITNNQNQVCYSKTINTGI